jgi:hypothetical protein
LTIQTTTTNPLLFSVPPALATDGTLTFTPASDGVGTANVTVIVIDNGGTANGGNDTTQRTFTITVRMVNKAPSFTAGPNVVVAAGASYSQTWATNISPGPPTESTQTFVFSVSSDRPDLFIIPPGISTAGLLSFTANGVPGTATVTVLLRDNGGTCGRRNRYERTANLHHPDDCGFRCRGQIPRPYRAGRKCCRFGSKHRARGICVEPHRELER